MLLIYPASKRFRWTGFIGSIQGWFRAHMVLGVLGPMFMLFHANFSLGATNSNAALIAMLIVSGSGLVGRYFYTRIHLGLTWRASRDVADLQAAAPTSSECRRFAFHARAPRAAGRGGRAHIGASAWGARVLLRPLFVTARMYVERWRLASLCTQAASHRCGRIADDRAGASNLGTRCDDTLPGDCRQPDAWPNSNRTNGCFRCGTCSICLCSSFC